MGKICDFWPINRISQKRCQIGPRLLLITNRKSYTGSRLAPNSMTMNDFECHNRGFYDFFDDFGLRNTFQERIAPKSIQIYQNKLHMKFSALNVNFDNPSLDFLSSRKPAHENTKERYPRKSRYFTVVGQSFVKTVADRHGHAAYYNRHYSFSVVSTSINMKNPELSK